MLKGDGEWGRVLKRYLKDCKYTLERDLTDLRFEPAQQILSRPLGRGNDPMPYLIISAREARFNLRHFEDNARNTVYILKISVHAVDKTQPLESTFKIIRKGFSHAAAKEAFLGWHFDQPDDPSVTYGVPIDIPISESVCSFLSLKTGTASVPSSHPATPVDANASNSYATSKLGGRDFMEDKVLDPESTVPGPQTVSLSKEQGPKPSVRDDIVVRNPVANNILHSATTPSHDGGKKVSPATVGSPGSCPTASSSTGKGTLSMTGMITLLSDPEVAKPHVSQHHLHLAGVSNRTNRLHTTGLAFTIPRLGLSSGPVAASTQAIRNIPVNQMSKETKIDLTIEPQASTIARPQAQPYTDAIITKVAELIAGYRQPQDAQRRRHLLFHTLPLPEAKQSGRSLL